MKTISNKSKNSGLIVLLLLVLTFGGCMKSGIQIITVPSQDVLLLNADQIIQILGRTGFSRNQIVEYGPTIREGLARSGRVEVKVNNKTEAAFAIKGNEVYISSLSRGYFIYNINTGWVGMQQRR